VNIEDLDINFLRRIVGVIEQDVYLFSTSIKANIAYGMVEATDQKIIDAAKAAQAHDFITEFNDGYDTIIGERGVTLSGGQKQRVAMARTFVTDPKILIMDDSTSAIDAETEQKIQVAMENLLQNRTTLIITHRLSTLRDADKIVFMRKGKIERMGTHNELLRDFPPYRQIFEGYIPLPPIGEND
jgi:ATP-binding cassette subfamily B protein